MCEKNTYYNNRNLDNRNETLIPIILKKKTNPTKSKLENPLNQKSSKMAITSWIPSTYERVSLYQSFLAQL